MGAELGQGEELGLDELGSFFFFLKGFGFCFLGEFLFVFCFPVFCLYSSLTSQPASLSLSLSLYFFLLTLPTALYLADSFASQSASTPSSFSEHPSKSPHMSEALMLILARARAHSLPAKAA